MIRELKPVSPPGAPARAGAIRVWSSDLFDKDGRLVHAMSMQGINLSLSSGGRRVRTVENRRALCRALDLPFAELTVAQQVHGCEVVPVDGALAGSGRESSTDAVAYVDGLFTRRPLSPLLGLTADCPILVLFDPATPAVGIAHAGWRGTLAGIATRLSQAMMMGFGSRPADLLAARRAHR